MSQSTTSTPEPASPEQIATLAHQGVQHFLLHGPLCPCRMHKHDPQEAIISTGSTIQRTASADYHYGCAGSNIRHALGGVDTFGNSESRSVTGQVLRGPFDIGTYFLPMFLSTKTVCEVTGEDILTFTLLPVHPSGQGRRMVDEDGKFDSATYPEEGLEEGVKLPPDGCSFFASLRGSAPRFFKDTATAADLAIEATSRVSYGPDIPPPWNIVGQDEKGRRVISLDWIQKGQTLHLADGLETEEPRKYYRLLSAWRHLSAENAKDEEQLLNILTATEKDEETMVSVLGGHEGKEQIRADLSDLRDILDSHFGTE